MDTEQGKVIDIRNGKAIIEMDTLGECHACGAKHACMAFGDGTKRRIEIPSTEDIRKGDRIALSFRPESRILSAFLIFILPLILMIAGYFIGLRLFHKEGAAIVSAFGGFFFSFAAFKLLDRWIVKEKKLLPHIRKIENEEVSLGKEDLSDHGRQYRLR